MRIHICFLFLLGLLLAAPLPANAYSLMTHEELIDLTWQDSIVPLLLSRYPNLTPAELENARAYAYGGCVVQDIGYYPYGDRFFSNLTHYVRSGDFIVALFRNAKNANEMAFAIGALSHYIGDSVGHPEATNRAVPIDFPALKERFGNAVNYAEGKHQHVQVEFGFDIDQIAHRRVAPLSYVRHVGLKVPVRLLSDSFYQTYGVSHFGRRHGRINVREYRFAVHTFIPRIAYAVTLLHRRHEIADPNTPEALEIEKEVADVSATNHWDSYRRRSTSFETYLLAGVLVLLPKVGPLALVSVKDPSQQTESDYMHSVYQSAQALRAALHRFTPPRTALQPDPPVKGGPLPVADRIMTPNQARKSPADDPDTGSEAQKPAPAAPLPVDRPSERAKPQRDPQHPLPNRDLDTGHVVQPGGYSLTDDTYADLLHRLTRTPQQPVPPGIVADIQTYYVNLDAPITTKKNTGKWNQVLDDLKLLASMPTSTSPEPLPTYGGENDDLDSQ